MSKRKTVHNKEAYARTLSIKGTVRQKVKTAAIQAPARTFVDRKAVDKRGGKQKHRGQGYSLV